MSDNENSTLQTLKFWFFKILAVYFCWKCNLHEPVILRILYLFVAYYFSVYYLLFYALYHWILRMPCTKNFGTAI